jgi:hypothetical protein
VTLLYAFKIGIEDQGNSNGHAKGCPGDEGTDYIEAEIGLFRLARSGILERETYDAEFSGPLPSPTNPGCDVQN